MLPWEHPKAYFVETKRKFSTRMNEHLAQYRLADRTSKVKQDTDNTNIPLHHNNENVKPK